MADRNSLTIDRVLKLLDFDHGSGVFTWKVSRGKARAGFRAGSLRSDGYRIICIDGCRLLEHRLAIFLTDGAWPIGDVDHKFGDKSDNRPSEIRAVSVLINRQNQRIAKRNSASGLIGAFFDARSKRWYSNIRVGTERLPLGRFNTPEDAHEAYVKAKRVLHAGCTI